MKVSYIGHGIEDVSSKVGRPLKSENSCASAPSLSPQQVKDFAFLFKFLNDKDKDILYLAFISQKRQSSIQQILNRSQPAIHYDLERIKKRLRFICYLNSVFDVFLDFLETKGLYYGEEELEILVLMFYTTSFTQSAQILGDEQIKVRNKFDKIIRHMEKYRHWDAYEIFMAIRSNLNIIKRVYAPRGKRKMVFVDSR